MPVPPHLARNVASARAAGLRYVDDGEPGITRVRHGGGFLYRDAKGRRVRNPRVLDRIRSLVIPPAWTDVWICAHENGHLQATGRDARARKQYRYHTHWGSMRDNGKYDRMVAFAQALPSIRRRVKADLKTTPLSRNYVLATVVTLLEKTLIRIGNREYARANKSFGLTTLQDGHVRIRGGSMRFTFRAKSGVMQDVELNDASLARIVKKCRSVPGRALFQYIGQDGRRQSIGSADVNAYLKAISGQPFTAKNFRTWAGTVLAARALCAYPKPASDAAFRRTVVQAVDAVASRLGNTRAVCRKSYVHPAVLSAFRSGLTIQKDTGGHRQPAGTLEGAGIVDDETAVLALLKRQARQTHERAAA